MNLENCRSEDFQKDQQSSMRKHPMKTHGNSEKAVNASEIHRKCWSSQKHTGKSVSISKHARKHVSSPKNMLSPHLSIWKGPLLGTVCLETTRGTLSSHWNIGAFALWQSQKQGSGRALPTPDVQRKTVQEQMANVLCCVYTYSSSITSTFYACELTHNWEIRWQRTWATLGWQQKKILASVTKFINHEMTLAGPEW